MPGVLTQLNRAFFRERYFQRCRAWDSLNPPRLGVRAPGLDDYGKKKARLYAIENEIMTWDAAGRGPVATWYEWLKHPSVCKQFRPFAAAEYVTNELEYFLTINSYVARGRPQSMLSAVRKKFLLRTSSWEVNAGSLSQAADLLIVYHPNPVPPHIHQAQAASVQAAINRGLQTVVEREIYKGSVVNLYSAWSAFTRASTFHAWIAERRRARLLHT